MRLVPLVLVLVVLGCSQSQIDPYGLKPVVDDPTVAPTATGSTTTTSSVTNSTVDTGPDPCIGVVPPAGPRPLSTLQITTEEDFDFDGNGWIVYQAGSIVAENQNGDFAVIAPAFGGDPSGIQVLSTNDLVVVSDIDSTVHVVYRGGGTEVVMNGFDLPNGIEVGENDRIYVSDYTAGKVRWHQQDTNMSGVVTGLLDNPDNLVLSNDEQTMYVATSDGVSILNRISDDEWDPVPTHVAQGLGALFVVEIDSCDNLYTAVGTEIYRIDLVAGTQERIADVPTGWSVSSLRWGNGVGGFDRNLLYATMRSDIHVIDVGIYGKRHPTTP